MNLTDLNVVKRETNSKSALKQLRKNGKIPAVFYGKGLESVSLAVSVSDFRKVHGRGLRNTPLNLKLEDGASLEAIVYKTDIDIITQDFTHIDFLKISADEEVKVRIPIRLNGVPFGVKTQGGKLFQDTKMVTVSCKPADIPEDIQVDVSDYKAGYTYYVRDLDFGNAKLASSDRAVLFSITKKGGVKKEETEEAEAEA